MQKKFLWIGLALVWASSLQVNAQDQDCTYKKWFVASSFLVLGTFNKVNNPKYVQLNVGYRITPKYFISYIFKRSIYSWPIGIPFGSSSFDAPGKNYPGHAPILAPKAGYQRFWWKGAYTSIYALNAFEKYMDANKKRLEMDTRYTWTSIWATSFNF